MNGPTTRKWCTFVALHNDHDVRWTLSTPTVDVDVVFSVEVQRRAVEVLVHDVRWILSAPTPSTLCINGRSGGSEWSRCTIMRVFESLAQPRRRPLEHERHSLPRRCEFARFRGGANSLAFAEVRIRSLRSLLSHGRGANSLREFARNFALRAKPVCFVCELRHN